MARSHTAIPPALKSTYFRLFISLLLRYALLCPISGRPLPKCASKPCDGIQALRRCRSSFVPVWWYAFIMCVCVTMDVEGTRKGRTGSIYFATRNSETAPMWRTHTHTHAPIYKPSNRCYPPSLPTVPFSSLSPKRKTCTFQHRSKRSTPKRIGDVGGLLNCPTVHCLVARARRKTVRNATRTVTRPNV